MKFKIIFYIILIITLGFINNCKADSFVNVVWNPSPDTNVVGYKIYYGSQSGIYTTSIIAGGVTNYLIDTTNFIYASTYYFVATSYNAEGWESSYSPEVAWIDTMSTNLTYIGVQVNYGLNEPLTNSQSIRVMSMVINPNYFFTDNLIITNNPLVGVKPTDTNQYTYLDAIVQYGTNLTSLTTNVYPLFVITNQPKYYYNSTVIISNSPF